MKTKFLLAFVIFLFSNSLFAYEDNSDSELEQYKKEIQDLVARVEILEHNLSKLEKQCSTKDANIVQRTETAVESKIVESENPDIFDVQYAKTNSNLPDTRSSAGIIDGVSEEKKQYDLALALLKDGKVSESEEKFMTFLSNYPKSSLAGNAYFWYAETFFKRKIFDKATINYLKGYKQSPKGTKAADSLLKLAIALGEVGKKKEACGVLAKLDAEFANRPASSIKRTKDSRVKFGCN